MQLRRAKTAVSLALLTATTGCFGTAPQVALSSLTTTAGTVFYHQTYAAGPDLTTSGGGALLEERRTEPFGAAIDAYRNGAVQTVDYRRDAVNALNKLTDPDTGWSYHGARWLAPETAQWQTPDPPATAPDPKYMMKPWGLNPYQYVLQNPVQFWDPDGRDDKLVHGSTTGGVILWGGGAVKKEYGKNDTVGIDVGRLEIKTSNLSIGVEVTGAKITGTWHPGDQDVVGVSGETSVFRGGAKLGIEGAEGELVAWEVKGGISAGPVGVGATAGISAGFKLGLRGGKLGGEIKLGIGLSFELDFGQLIPDDVFHDAWRDIHEGQRLRAEQRAKAAARQQRIGDATEKALHDPDSPFFLPPPPPEQSCRPQPTLADLIGPST